MEKKIEEMNSLEILGMLYKLDAEYASQKQALTQLYAKKIEEEKDGIDKTKNSK